MLIHMAILFIVKYFTLLFPQLTLSLHTIFAFPNIELPYNKLSLQQNNYSAGAYNGM